MNPMIVNAIALTLNRPREAMIDDVLCDSISLESEPKVRHFTKAEAIEFFGPGKVQVKRTRWRNVVEINGVLCQIAGHKSKPLTEAKVIEAGLTPEQLRNRRRNQRKKLSR